MITGFASFPRCLGCFTNGVSSAVVFGDTVTFKTAQVCETSEDNIFIFFNVFWNYETKVNKDANTFVGSLRGLYAALNSFHAFAHKLMNRCKPNIHLIIGDLLVYNILSNKLQNIVINHDSTIIKNEIYFLQSIGFKIIFYYIPFNTPIGNL